jgi:anthranilate/para-aminobenzoate synthase component I
MRNNRSVPAPSDPLSAARYLHEAGEPVALLLAGAPGPDPGRSLLATRPDEKIVTAPGSGAGLPAIPPRLVHAAHGQGLWAGAIAYDAGLGLLGIPSRHDPVVPAFAATYHRTYAAFDHVAGTWQVHGPAGASHALLTDAIAAGPSTAAPSEIAPRVARSAVTRAEHAALCDEVKRLIALGELFEVNLAHVLDVEWQLDGFALFERLVAAGPGDHSAYLEAGDAVLASVSPELFLRIERDRCETRPIKGTRRRGATPAEDATLAAELQASVKDRAENVMIVDLLRNDLVPTSVPGSVQVMQLCEVERTASVIHLVSSVAATVRPDVRHPDVLVSCFPGGSITGAPKRRAMEIIDRLEREPRGFYCGSVFSWEPAAQRLIASVAIRTATVQDGRARYGAGGAVTLLSDAAEEAEETMVKAQPFLRATGATGAGW